MTEPEWPAASDDARRLIARAGAPALGREERARIRAGLGVRRRRSWAVWVGLGVAAVSGTAMAAWLGRVPGRSASAPRLIMSAPAAPQVEAAPEDVGTTALRRALQALNDRRATEAVDIARSGLARIPQGPLTPELRLVEVRGLILDRREVEALALLESLPLESYPRADDLAVLRAELWARSGSCGRAVEARNALLARPIGEALAVRLRGLCETEPR